MKNSTMKPIHSKVTPEIEGRKNFAMSMCEGVIHITGGMDAKGKILSDIWSFSLRDRSWEKLTV